MERPFKDLTDEELKEHIYIANRKTGSSRKLQILLSESLERALIKKPMKRDFEILNQKPKGRDPKEETPKQAIARRLKIIEDEMTIIRLSQLNIDRQVNEIKNLNK